jgi:CBS domain containing-hemolysin-like protein
MNLSPFMVVVITVVIIALSAFFVAAEFALLAAKRHRLEDRALRSRSARAALRNASELTVLLAGSQLGITVSALALGAITKPAVHDWLVPAFEGFGIPEVTADIVAFILALFVVTFLHLVVGEMAPKSWAIAHPELSATLLAIPMRGFLFVTRPILIALNNSANWLLKRVGVDPVNSVSAAQNTDSLKQLVQHSVHTGALEIEYSTRVAAALAMQSTPVKTLVPAGIPIAMVATSATVGQVREASETSGHHRIIVGDHVSQGSSGELDTKVVGVVHVRDTLTSSENMSIRRLIRPILRLPADQSIYESLAHMRRSSSHIAVVMEGVRVVGLVTLSDVISGLVQRDDPTTAHDSYAPNTPT